LPMLNPLKYGLFAWQLFSHKLCRWLVPFAMITAFMANAILAVGLPPYRVILGLHCIFYVFAVMYHWFKWLPDKNIFRLPSFFVIVNVSILDAWYRYFRGDRIFRWEPSKR
jgi:hypothetical protein